MPGPLTSAYNWATSPLVPKSAIQPAQDALEQPKLAQSPWVARVKGFGSGALEGLRSLTSPTQLAGLATMGMGSGASAGAKVAEDLAGVTPELMSAAPEVSQSLPSASDVNALSGLLKYNLAKVPTSASKALAQPGAATLGAIQPSGYMEDFVSNPLTEGAIQRLARDPNNTLQRMRGAGEFVGDRTVGAGNLMPSVFRNTP